MLPDVPEDRGELGRGACGGESQPMRRLMPVGSALPVRATVRR